jgi:hypothetical protein
VPQWRSSTKRPAARTITTDIPTTRFATSLRPTHTLAEPADVAPAACIRWLPPSPQPLATEAAEAAVAAVGAPEPAAFPPIMPTGNARPPIRPRQPSCPPPFKVRRQAQATASSSAAVVAPTEPAAVARSSANKLSVGRNHRPSTAGSCGLELALRRLMNTLLTKSKRERCRETI